MFLLGCNQIPAGESVSPSLAPGTSDPITQLDVPELLANKTMLEALATDYYQQHDDLVDMLVIWGTPKFAPGNAFYLPVQNDVPGIGYQHVGPELFNDSAAFGSDRLQGVIWMGTGWMDNSETIGPGSVLGILAQETAHRWGSTIHFQSPQMKSPSANLLGTPFHWSFFLETGGSPLGGNHWTEIALHVFRAEPVAEVSFSPVDLYLMGLLPADQVPPLRLLVNVRSADNAAPDGFSALGGRVTHPVEVPADVLEIPIEQIIETEGLRDPEVGFNASEVRQAWIIVGSESSDVSPEYIEKLVPLQQVWPEVFARMTNGRARILTSSYPSQSPPDVASPRTAGSP